MKTEYEFLEEWKRPSSYAGPDWYGWYPIVGRSRESDCLERSNFDAALEALGPAQEAVARDPDGGEARMFSGLGDTVDGGDVVVVRESHWAVGWVEWLGVRMTAPRELLEKADHLLKRLDNYPILDEDRFSEYEQEEADLVWKDCYRTNERIEYIRKHRNQFEFRSIEDMLGCVRGKYFAGYACELIG